MYNLVALLSLLVLSSHSLATPAGNTVSARQVPSKPCSHLTGGVHVIAAGGTGIQNIGNGPYGLIGSLSASILRALPGSTNISLPYDKSTPGGQAEINNLDNGAALLHNFIADYRNSCPDTKIVLLGYASGAAITMNTLCGASAPFSKPPGPIGTGGNPYLATKIIAAVVYGDPTRSPYLSYDLGYNSGGCSGKQARSNAGSCIMANTAYQSYADSGDPTTCVQNGTDPNAQYGYAKYDSAATQFVVDRFRATGGA